MNKVNLVIIFNHRYDDNIIKLKSIYQDKFNNIIFLIPFYEGKDENVIPVYECSYQFSGFLIQAYDKLISNKADYYFFISDDVILSPDINEKNILDKLKVENKDIFISKLTPLNSKGMFDWSHARFSSIPFFKKYQTQWEGSIPDYQSALEKFYLFFGEKYREEYGDAFFDGNFLINNIQEKKEEIKTFIKRNDNTLKIPYPMAMGYSDIFMIKREKLFTISRLCGVFSAMNMFSEISLPTAIVLSVDRKDVVLLSDIDFQYIAEWEEERGSMEEKYQLNLKLLYKNWEKKNLFVHPIKLSKWKLS